VSILDNFSNSNAKSVDRIAEIAGTRPKVFDVDMCNAQAVAKVFARNHFDGVIHFAGLKACGESVAKPIMYYQNNIVGTLNILKAMEENSCKSLVFFLFSVCVPALRRASR
jgi:UDP-glucose 4-epimerase